MLLALTKTFQTVILGTTVLGAVGGVIGCFALLRRQSLLGDALSHAALPGVCVAFILVGGKDSSALLLGALVSGIVGALFILLVVRGSRIKEDSAIGIVLSVFFGLGIVLLTRIQRGESGDQTGLETFLFGQAATLMVRDIWLFVIVGLVVLAVVAAFFKEFKLLCFDLSFGTTVGYPMRRLEITLTCLLVVVVVIGLQTVGVVLMLAALITPAAAARQWTDRFARMLVLSGAIGGLSSAVGVFVSDASERHPLPTGPVIVLTSSTFLILSLLLAPRRGMVWALWHRRELAWRIRRENLLKDLYGWGERRGNWGDAASLPALMGIRGQSGRRVLRTAGRLEKSGQVELLGQELRLTAAGLDEAERVVRKHRLWELYLSRRLDLPADHLHRDAEAMEHALTDEAASEFEELLGFPEVDPHGRRIPPRRKS